MVKNKRAKKNNFDYGPESSSNVDKEVEDTMEKKSIYDLTSAELKKEAVKLGLIGEGEKSKKEVLLVKLSAFLSAKNIDISNFEFAPNGGTIFPANLSESTAKESEKSDSEDSEEEDEDEEVI